MNRSELKLRNAGREFARRIGVRDVRELEAAGLICIRPLFSVNPMMIADVVDTIPSWVPRLAAQTLPVGGQYRDGRWGVWWLPGKEDTRVETQWIPLYVWRVWAVWGDRPERELVLRWLLQDVGRPEAMQAAIALRNVSTDTWVASMAESLIAGSYEDIGRRAGDACIQLGA